jgi:RNA polymerase-binding protein DksA
MKRTELTSLAKVLRDRRKAVFREVEQAEAGLQFIAEDRESELEERAQEERLARLFDRLDLRGKREIEAIDAALERIRKGTYGTCARCGGQIAAARLHALPHAALCFDCARAAEAGVAAEEREAEAPRAGAVPPEFANLSDRDMETVLREQVRADGRVDLHELRIICRHGVVYLDGAVPSEAEHAILLKLIADVAGFEEIFDRVQVKEILWDRADRAKEPVVEEAAVQAEPAYTEDVVESVEDGIEYTPPVQPPADEE